MYEFTRNRRPFHEVCHNSYGRKIITTNAKAITKENIVKELAKALSVHWRNREEIDYLNRYYMGDQPILYYKKKIRPEINNKVVENHAFEIVEHKTAELHGEPIQLVLRGTDDSKTKSMKNMNDYNEIADKPSCDTEIGRWRSICGTGYRFIKKNDDYFLDENEAPYDLLSENPLDTFVCYGASTKKPMYSCQIRKDENNEQYFFIFTKTNTFKVKNGKLIEAKANGYFTIPIIEYPNNNRRLSDIEIVIALLDELNKMQSNRMNGIEQFVQALTKYKNVEVDKEKIKEIQEVGGISFTVPQGQTGDVELMTAELNQEQTQVAKDDVWRNVLSVEGMPSRESNTGGDTGQAVYLRNGWDFSENRAELSEQEYKKAEKQAIKVMLSILRTLELTELELKDIEIKIKRSKMDNMMVKAQVAQILLKAGFEPKLVTKVINLFADDEEAYRDSKPYLDAIYQTVDSIKENGVILNGGNATSQVSKVPEDVVQS